MIACLILCPLAFLIGWLAHDELIIRQENRERPLLEALYHYHLDAAYRAGQMNSAGQCDPPLPPVQDAEEMIQIWYRQNP